MSRKAELIIQMQIAEYLRRQYPAVLFRSDLGGIRLTIGQAVQVKKLQAGRAWPDMVICEPRNGLFGYFGEIKVSESEVYTQDWKIQKDEHIQEQWQMIQELRRRGYEADWWFGFDDAKEKIDMYLSFPVF